MTPVSLFNYIALKVMPMYVVLCALCVACVDGSFVQNVLTRALVLQWACMLVPTATVVCTNVLVLDFPNYAYAVACDN